MHTLCFYFYRVALKETRNSQQLIDSGLALKFSSAYTFKNKISFKDLSKQEKSFIQNQIPREKYMHRGLQTHTHTQDLRQDVRL